MPIATAAEKDCLGLLLMFCDSLEDHRLKGVSNWMPKNCGLSPYSQSFPEEVNRGFEEEYSCSSSCKTVWSLHG